MMTLPPHPSCFSTRHLIEMKRGEKHICSIKSNTQTVCVCVCKWANLMWKILMEEHFLYWLHGTELVAVHNRWFEVFWHFFLGGGVWPHISCIGNAPPVHKDASAVNVISYHSCETPSMVVEISRWLISHFVLCNLPLHGEPRRALFVFMFASFFLPLNSPGLHLLHTFPPDGKFRGMDVFKGGKLKNSWSFDMEMLQLVCW